jgi:hypothetical protein
MVLAEGAKVQRSTRGIIAGQTARTGAGIATTSTRRRRAIIVATEWNQFRALNTDRLKPR